MPATPAADGAIHGRIPAASREPFGCVSRRYTPAPAASRPTPPTTSATSAFFFAPSASALSCDGAFFACAYARTPNVPPIANSAPPPAIRIVGSWLLLAALPDRGCGGGGAAGSVVVGGAAGGADDDAAGTALAFSNTSSTVLCSPVATVKLAVALRPPSAWATISCLPGSTMRGRSSATSAARAPSTRSSTSRVSAGTIAIFTWATCASSSVTASRAMGTYGSVAALGGHFRNARRFSSAAAGRPTFFWAMPRLYSVIAARRSSSDCWKRAAACSHFPSCASCEPSLKRSRAAATSPGVSARAGAASERLTSAGRTSRLVQRASVTA